VVRNEDNFQQLSFEDKWEQYSAFLHRMISDGKDLKNNSFFFYWFSRHLQVIFERLFVGKPFESDLGALVGAIMIAGINSDGTGKVRYAEETSRESNAKGGTPQKKRRAENDEAESKKRKMEVAVLLAVMKRKPSAESKVQLLEEAPEKAQGVVVVPTDALQVGDILEEPCEGESMGKPDEGESALKPPPPDDLD
jgi:hypothetical protein